MPLFEVLYYPFFEPTEIWLRRYLLVYDKVWSVVPKDANFRPSRGIAEIAELIPNSFETISPTEDDKTSEKIDIDRLEKAFKLISAGKKNMVNRKELVLRIDTHNGGLEIAGHTLLHSDKITHNIFNLLNKYNLINKKAKDVVTSVNSDINDYMVVDVAAANLIVSNLADRIAQRRAFSTITDQEIPFMVSSLDSIQQKTSTTKVRTMLASMVLKFEIPEDIGSLNHRRYKELRDSYCDIRETFHSVIMNINNLYQLDQISDQNVLHEKIVGVTRNFDSEVQKYKKSIAGKKVKRWAPLGIGSLATIGGAIISSPEIILTSAGLSVIVAIVQEVFIGKEEETEKNKLKKMLTSIQKDIINKTKVRKLDRKSVV